MKLRMNSFPLWSITSEEEKIKIVMIFFLFVDFLEYVF